MLKTHMLSDLFVKIIADYTVVPIVLIAGVAMLVLVRRDRYQVYGRALMAGLSALLIAKIASLFYQGQRPFEVMGTQPLAAYLQNPGFPSDHVLFVFIISLVVWASTKNKPVGLVLLVLSCAVAAGRVIALVHTPIDVAGGIACALLAALLIYGRQLFVYNKTS